MAYSTELSECILKHYTYDMETSQIRNRITKKALSPCVKAKGYLQVCLTLNGKYKSMTVHRLAWFLIHHAWPNGEIDHIDGNRQNNRIDNLRVVSRKENNAFRIYKWPVMDEKPPVQLIQNRNFYSTRIQSSRVSYFDAYGLFFYAILLGKRYK